MNVLLFPTYLLNESTRAVSIELGRELKRTGHNVAMLICAMNKGYCEINPYGSKVICRNCKKMAHEVVDYVKPDSIQYFKNDNIINGLIEKSDKKAILKSSYGVFANIIRSSKMNLLNKDERKFTARIFKQTIQLQKYITNLISEKYPINSVYTFNGRYPNNIAAVHSAQSCKNVDFFLYEIWLQKTPIISKNTFIHNPDFAKYVVDRMLRMHEYTSMRETAYEYLQRRITGDYYFFDNPIISKPFKGPTSKNNDIKKINDLKIVVCPSSTFEYNFHPYGFDPCNQPLEIQSLINNLNNNNKKIIIDVRLHPNMSLSPKEEINEYFSIDSKSENIIINIIEPNSNLSTYDLIKNADYVIAFASFTSCEATLMGKKVIQIGPSRYSKLKFSKNTESGLEVANKINNNSIQNNEDDRREAIAFIASMFDNSYFINNYKLNNDLTIYAGNERIQNTRFMVLSTKLVKFISYLKYGRGSIFKNISKIKRYSLALIGNKVAY